MMDSKQAFKRFLVLWVGELISAIGSGLSSFGLGVYVFQKTGKASAMALVTLLAFVPSLVLSAPAGVLADRYDRRLLMILGDSLSVIGLVFIWGCMLKGEASIWQIGIGVAVSSIFAALMEPAYKATITDLLDEEDYTKASGLVQMAGASKFLISPVLAGALLSISDVKLLLLLDICTFFVTVASTLAVKKGIAAKPIATQDEPMFEALKGGWKEVTANKGVFILVCMTSLLTFFMGFIQTLAMPMLLAFTTSTVAGIMETIMAVGMLVSSFMIGIMKIEKGYVKLLCGSLALSGGFMMLFGLRENIILISIVGFGFFATLPFANASLDYLVRTHIQNEVQGRAWGLIGLISQLGYVVAYATCGILADYIFTPLLLEEGYLAGSVGKLIGVGSGRGTGFLIMVAGMLLALAAIGLYQIKSVQQLEEH